MRYYCWSSKHGGLLVNLETLEASKVEANELDALVRSKNDIVNAFVDDISDHVFYNAVGRGYNDTDFEIVTDNVEFVFKDLYKYIWYEGVLYRLSGELAYCAYIYDNDLFVIVDNICMGRDALRPICNCERSCIKKCLLLE